MASALVLLISGFGYFVYDNLRSLGSSHAIGDGPRSTDGATNILLIGLDSRKDQNGNDLPAAILDQLHAGSKEGVDNGVGGYNTNTLILLHVPNNGGKATAFSIPRDDYVKYADAIGTQQEGKIKEAYGVTKYFKELELSKQGIHDHVTLEHQGREAARRATIATVRRLLGVPIDHFAEINLAGFYDLATALGGVDVCLNHPVQDSYSGADFPAGVQHLDGSQALAFVRQRHGLDNGDLDRTHRQQAFLSSVTHQLRTKGVFGDLGQMQALLNVAKKDVVIDAGWDVLGFAQQAQNLTGGNIDFYTLPIDHFGQVHGQDVNIIDPVKVRAIVQNMIGPKKPRPAPTASVPLPTSTVDVLNAGGTHGLAARVAARLTSYGYITGTVGNAPQPHRRTTVLYGPGSPSGAADAAKLARLFGVKATADPSVTAGRVQLELGRRAVPPPPPAHPLTPARPHPVATMPSQGAQGGQVRGGGIPCVN